MLEARRQTIISEGPYYIKTQRNIENPNILYVVVVDKFGVARASHEVFGETALYFELAIQHAYEEETNQWRARFCPNCGADMRR